MMLEATVSLRCGKGRLGSSETSFKKVGDIISVKKCPCVWSLSVDEIIEKNIEARGGRDAWKAASGFRMKGAAANAGTAAGAVETPFLVEIVRPDKIRSPFGSALPTVLLMALAGR